MKIPVSRRRAGALATGAGGLLLGLLLGAPSAHAQSGPLGDAFIVQEFRVEGLQRIAEGTVYNYLPINIGDVVDSQRISEAIRALFGTGFFEDVEFRQEDNRLIIAVRERPSILDFTITGNEQIDDEPLRQAMAGAGLRPGRTFDRAILDEVTQFLTEQYYNMGKYGVVVDTDVQELPDNQVQIAIEIQEGERARIRQINIVGNEAFSDRDLLGEFQLTTRRWDSWFRQNDRYAREILQGDLETLRSYYMDRGFADFGLESVQVAISPDKRDVYITVNLDEGDRYVIGDVRLAGRLPVPEDELMALVLVQPGQTFSQRLLNETAEFIGMRLGQDGYAFADIQPQPELNRETNEVTVSIFIEPNNRVYVRRINFEGTDRVNDEVFRRELRQLEGGYLSNTLVQRSEVRLAQLPYLDNVNVETRPVPGLSDQVDLDFEVEYGMPGEFNFGLGWSASERFILQGSFVHSNFLGNGQRLSGEVNASRYATVYSLSHTDPYTNIDELSRSISVSYQDIVQFTSQTSDFSTKTFASSLSYAYPITEYQQVRYGVTWQRAELLTDSLSTVQSQHWVQNNAKSYSQSFPEQEYALFGTKFDAFEISLGWGFNSRNRSLFATRGAQHTLNLAYSVPLSDVEYVSLNYNGVQHANLPGPFGLRLSANVSYGQALGDTTSLPPFRNRFAGGPGTVRGFREMRLGPMDSFGNPYGGNILTAASAELTLPIPDTWRNRSRIALFYDVGNVFSDEGVPFFDLQGDPINYRFDLDELRHSVGIGAEWLAPMGLFRISYAIPLNAFPGDARRPADRTERFQFTIGSAF